ncbi:FKBP-type peptidyl-prolyl cis-trans isomerase [Pseudoteredinibacter isoporae]|uniref:Peptidyl-prolyl cis-trans isomerase n=1 Tax=Pseudoteredinibacter isoporae TaxID=570281 RepID=A0A7X0JTV4_9GAMM|nr:peptidylprolyl isomerase [Pseudoteredinibacter isoporae]MBB6522170.1 FKBP-type peptidyl-prolyl cis-trans isomerase SlyD [Pseudoteredinibacter isoporae]NHO87705.1 peptidylprolyl isomerase [Pseudoteredinibacter isoporae]NIB23964.1 peptidylprolyl isomerase [Pseudoteredinibacter isoporae]
MELKNELVGIIHYTLRDDKGETIDTSEGEAPLEYLHGFQNIVPGLEDALSGKKVGDNFKVSVEPEQGYGELDPTLVQELPKDMFQGVDQVEVGMAFHAETQNGMQTVEVIEVDEDTVTIDGNHPLAGQTLNFDIEVVGIREATPDELEHGHVHSGEDGAH